MIITIFTACGEKTTEKAPSDDTTVSTSEQTSNETPADNSTSGITATKLGATTKPPYSLSSKGYVYTDSTTKKYGIISFDTQSDTGAKYVYCDVEGDYFIIRLDNITSETDLTSINAYGMIDEKGNEIIPQEYAIIKKINDRYYKVSKATEKVATKDESDIYLTSSLFVGGKADAYYKATCYVYDTVNKKIVPNSTTKNTSSYSAYESLISYIDNNNTRIYINENGTPLPSDAKVLDNGAYISNNVIYASNGSKLFDVDTTGYAAYSYSGGYYIGRKIDSANNVSYAVLDASGKVVSTTFKNPPQVFNNLINTTDGFYKFDGTSVIEGKFTLGFISDKFNTPTIIAYADTTAYLIDSNGNILYTGKKDDPEIEINTSYISFSKKTSNDKKLFYSFVDNDFTIEAKFPVAPWIVKSDTSVICTLTNEVLVTGYSYYTLQTVDGVGIYVIAYNDNASYDIYLIK